MKLKALAPAILLILLLSTVAGTFFIHLTQANPYRRDVKFTEVPPPAGAQPPVIIIRTPQNGSYYPKNFNLTFDVNVLETNGDKSIRSVTELYYKCSWDSTEIAVTQRGFSGNASFSIDLSDIPGGNHSLTIYAVGYGSYEVNREFVDEITILYYIEGFKMTGFSTVRFTKDPVSPRISFLSPPNRTYFSSDVELDFAVSEAASEILYCVDGKQNQTITDSLNLMGLEEGFHNVTLYAADLAGNAAEPKTLFFNVDLPKPFPVETVATASAATVAVVGVGLLLHFRKRKASPPVNFRPKAKTLFTVAFLSMILLPTAIGMLPVHRVSGNFVYQPERVPEGIRINPDGTVEGTTNIQRNGNTYTLTDNLYRTIVVLRDGIVLDGAGYTLQGHGAESGVFLQERNSVTIKNLKIGNFEYGIKFTWAILGGQPVRRNNKIIGNTISNNKHGIAFNDYSEGNWISDNYITDNSHGIQLHQSNNVLRNNKFVGNNRSISDYGAKINDIDTSNTVDGKPVYYWVDKHDRTVPSDAGWVVLRNCSRIKVENLNLESNAQGIFLYNTNSTTINGNSVTNNGDGIFLLTSSNNIISNNNLTKNDGCGIQLQSESNNNSIIENRICENARQGISISFSHGTTILKNQIAANECGIKLEFAKESDITENNVTLNEGTGIDLSYETCNNTISRNAISKNALGISMGLTSQILPALNIITENTIRENNGWGIKIDPTQSKNVIHHNNFINNNVTEGLQVSNPGQWTYRGGRAQWLPGNLNAWDDGREGNYWSDYETRYPEADESENSGVWNTPFYINENNMDCFPLMNPWEIHSPETENETALGIVSFPTVLVVASFVTLAFLGYGLLMNLIKRKKARER